MSVYILVPVKEGKTHYWALIETEPFSSNSESRIIETFPEHEKDKAIATRDEYVALRKL